MPNPLQRLQRLHRLVAPVSSEAFKALPLSTTDFAPQNLSLVQGKSVDQGVRETRPSLPPAKQSGMTSALPIWHCHGVPLGSLSILLWCDVLCRVGFLPSQDILNQHGDSSKHNGLNFLGTF